jgi:tetratricopeptide (TPR) repeat protein
MRHRLHIFFIFLLLLFYTVPVISFPDSVSTKKYYDLSWKFLKEKKYKEAVENAKKAEAEDPSDPFYAYNTGEIYYRSYDQGKFLDKKVYMPLAVSSFEKALKAGYSKPKCLHFQARCYYQINEFEKSTELFQRVADIYRKEMHEFEKNNDERNASIKKRELADAVQWLSKIYEYTGELDKFHAAVLEAYELNPKDQWLPGKLKKSYRIKGHLALAKGEYDNALEYYKKAEDKNWQEICGKRKALGQIHPEYTHVILVLYFTKITAIDGSGKLISEPAVTESMKEKCRMWQGAYKAWTEVYSGGKWTVEFRSIDVETLYKEDLGIKPYNTSFIRETEDIFKVYNDIDTYAVVSPSVSPGYGGYGKFEFIPGIFRGRSRGWFQVNCTYHEFNMWLHEFFHVIEKMAKISPPHGFRKDKRKYFPGWKGNTEEEYYAWHFQTTLPKVGWKNLTFKDFAAQKPLAGNTYAYLHEFYKSLETEDIIKADNLIREANQLYKSKNVKKGVKRLAEAATLRPFLQDALKRLVDYYARETGDYKKVFSYYERMALVDTGPKLEPLKMELLNPVEFDKKTGAVTITTASVYGTTAGMWIPGRMSTSGIQYEWDVTDKITRPGVYEVTFWYTAGWKAVSIEWAALYSGTQELAKDPHEGFSGNVKKDITYTLELKKYDKNDRYTIKARLAGSGGTDSTGLMFIKKR